MSKPKMIRAAMVDLNGVWRGKLMPQAQLEKVLAGGMRMPFATPSIDIWGEDIVGSPLIYETGDSDGICLPTGRGALFENWLSGPAQLVPVWMTDESGQPSKIDPRQILAKVTKQFHEMGLTPVVALEMEFYLLDASQDRPVSPISPTNGRILEGDGILTLADIDQFDAFFNDLYQACANFGIPADATISEGGAGQFEINLLHVDDPLRAADNAQFFKRIVKGVARKHAMAASFMAKPYQDRAGNGLHVHFSLLDSNGDNVFNNGTDKGSAMLQNAVGGLLHHMPASTLIFAPHLNSYRRLKPNSHAPTGIGWGYENRTAAIRIPGGPAIARRIEHRVAGGDSNPYLVLAAILAAALDGLKNQTPAPAPIVGNAYEADLVQLPTDWQSAITSFENSPAILDLFSPLFQQMYGAMKQQEYNRFASKVSDFEVATYLESV